MSTLVYMKMLEQTPAKYDRGMRILTLGRIDEIKREIASHLVEPGHEILELGCGTGALAAMMAERGAEVVALDVSEPMLAEARMKAPAVQFLHRTATEIEELGSGRFDRVVGTLVLSELSDDEVDFVLRAALTVLKPGGLLVLADEIRPARLLERLPFYAVRWPLAAVTFALTQNSTHALKNIEGRLERAGFRAVCLKRYLLGSLALITAEKISCGNG
jgi:demethylmenaquinone methyltransferase/2-methoxy-6-polyprenyl-1,4-benzoquinol methylase